MVCLVDKMLSTATAKNPSADGSVTSGTSSLGLRSSTVVGPKSNLVSHGLPRDLGGFGCQLLGLDRILLIV